MNDFEYNLLEFFYELEEPEQLSWYPTSDKTIRFTILCNDMFYWGCSDYEPINTNEDIKTLKKAKTDLNNLKNHYQGYDVHACELWVCRKRKMRPQGAYYNYLPEEVWPLFNECGPEREVGYGNPYKIGDYKGIKIDERDNTN